MKRSGFLFLVLGTLVSATCLALAPKASVATATDVGSAAAIDASDTSRIVATIRGTSGITNVQGDKVELRNGIAYINEHTYGAVPAPAEIKYIITPSRRELFVNGKPRTAALAVK
jgi:hypothetical protein